MIASHDNGNMRHVRGALPQRLICEVLSKAGFDHTIRIDADHDPQVGHGGWEIRCISDTWGIHLGYDEVARGLPCKPSRIVVQGYQRMQVETLDGLEGLLTKAVSEHNVGPCDKDTELKLATVRRKVETSCLAVQTPTSTDGDPMPKPHPPSEIPPGFSWIPMPRSQVAIFGPAYVSLAPPNFTVSIEFLHDGPLPSSPDHVPPDGMGCAGGTSPQRGTGSGGTSPDRRGRKKRQDRARGIWKHVTFATRNVGSERGGQLPVPARRGARTAEAVGHAVAHRGRPDAAAAAQVGYDPSRRMPANYACPQDRKERWPRLVQGPAENRPLDGSEQPRNANAAPAKRQQHQLSVITPGGAPAHPITPLDGDASTADASSGEYPTDTSHQSNGGQMDPGSARALQRPPGLDRPRKVFLSLWSSRFVRTGRFESSFVSDAFQSPGPCRSD